MNNIRTHGEDGSLQETNPELFLSLISGSRYKKCERRNIVDTDRLMHFTVYVFLISTKQREQGNIITYMKSQRVTDTVRENVGDCNKTEKKAPPSRFTGTCPWTLSCWL